MRRRIEDIIGEDSLYVKKVKVKVKVKGMIWRDYVGRRDWKLGMRLHVGRGGVCDAVIRRLH
jgi:hypothetical protein